MSMTNNPKAGPPQTVPPPVPPTGVQAVSPSAGTGRASGLRWAFRFLRWSTYLAALITLILLLHNSAPPAVVTTTQAAESAERKVEQVQRSVADGQPATLRLDQSELNSYLATHLDFAPSANALASGGIVKAEGGNSSGSATPNLDTNLSDKDAEQMRSSVRDVKVQMEGDVVKAYMVFDVHGKDMTLELAGRLGAQDGFLKFEPVSGQIGSLPIPQSALASAVQKLMESPVNREKLKLPADIQDLHIENGELVATYH
jgi:hypothetical protein